MVTTGRSWVWLMLPGFGVTFAGQTLINLFIEGIGNRPLVPIPGDYLILVGSLATGFGSAWFSRSGPGLLRGPRPATEKETFGFEVLVTGVMVLLTNMCGWLALEAIRVVVNPNETNEDRLLSIPLVLAVVFVCAFALLIIAACARRQPETPSPLAVGAKSMIRSRRLWKWLGKPREKWHPTRATVMWMYTLLYAGLALRVVAGVVIGSTVSAILAEPGERELADFWSSGGLIASLICAGIGLSIAGLPEKLLPKRDVSRGRQVFEEIANASISGLALVVIPVLIVGLEVSLPGLLIIGPFYVVVLGVLWGRNTSSQRSIDAWAEPVFKAKRVKKTAKKRLRELKRTHAKLRTLGDEAEKERSLAAEEIASAEAVETAAGEALEAARGGKE